MNVMTVISDADCLAAFRAGDDEAFAVLVARHQGVVRAACQRQVAGSECDDCVQAVFLVLARRPSAAARAPVLAAWLLRVAWYVCSRAQRATQRRRQVALSVADAHGPSATPHTEALDHLDDCLLRLPERQRLALSLHYLAGQAHEDVARALGVSRDNAYQLVSRGLDSLRTQLARRGFALGGAALATLLAGEAQAASTTSLAGTTTSLISTLGTPPSAAVLKLANGASTAMTITAWIPAAAAAALLLPIGIAATLMSAEPAVNPPAPGGGAQVGGGAQSTLPRPGPGGVLESPVATSEGTVQQVLTGGGAHVGGGAQSTPPRSGGGGGVPGSPAATSARAVQQAIVQRLDQEITVEFSDTPLGDAIAFVGESTGLNIILGSRVPQDTPCTMKVTGTKVRDVCTFLENSTGLTHTICNGAYLIHLPLSEADQQRLATNSRCDFTGLDQQPEIRDRLQQKVTTALKGVAMTEVLQFLESVMSVKVVSDPEVRERRVTLVGREMRFQDTLAMLCELSDSNLHLDGKTIVITATAPLASPATN